MVSPTHLPLGDRLVEQIEPHRDGLAIDRLTELNPDVSRRTIQRRLAKLVESGRIQGTGRSRARRYVVPPIERKGRTRGTGHAPAADDWCSAAGLEVRDLIGRPLVRRTPVGYQRNLLDEYRPNEDAYLPATLRRHLHDRGRSPEGERPAGTYARQILDRLLIDLSWASSRLEGNTYTRLDTQNLIEFGELASGKDQREAQMILNHKAAIEMLVEDVATVDFNRFTLLNLHALLADNLLTDPGAAGRLRRIPVGISGTVYQSTGIPQVIEECFDQLLAKAIAIRDPFEQAFFVMVHVPYLQPFEDVNKRTSRLAANIPFIKHNLAPLSFVDIPTDSYVEAILGVYELGRTELLSDIFAWAYERSCQRYTVLRDALPTPDPLRLRYRAVLAELVSGTVRSGEEIELARLRERGREIVDAADLEDVVAMALNELHRLHEGNIARFRLRVVEFRAWREATRVL